MNKQSLCYFLVYIYAVTAYCAEEIIKNDLLLLIEAKRDAIADLKMNYLTSHIDKDGKQQLEQVCFAKSGNHTYLKCRSLNEKPEKYSFGLCRNDKGYFNYSEDSPGQYSGTIQSYKDEIPSLYRGGISPMGSYMMIDTKREFGMEIMPYDLVALLRNEYTKVKEQDGKIIVSNGDPVFIRVTVDPEKNYAIERYEEYKTGYSEGKVIYHELITYTEYGDYYDAGEGVWLAGKIHRKYYHIQQQNGNVSKNLLNEYTFQIQDIKVNQGIDEKEFNDFFPVGTDVYDVVNGLAYEIGGDMSIEGVITEAVEEFKNPQLDSLDSKVQVANHSEIYTEMESGEKQTYHATADSESASVIPKKKQVPFILLPSLLLTTLVFGVLYIRYIVKKKDVS